MKFGFSMFARPDRDAKEPMTDMFRVAERADELGYDQLSGGRAFVGAGIGYRPYEYEALGIPFSQRDARLTEAYQILHRTWTEDHLTYHGEHFSFDDVTLSPRPIQQPIPIWAGANRPPAVRRAAADADGWLIGFADKLDSLRTKVPEYRRLAADNGRPSTVCLMRLVGVASTRAEVEERWFPPVLGMLRRYRRVGAPAERNAQLSQKLRSQGDRLTLEQIGTDMIVAGTPDDCVDGVQRFERATGCEYFHLYLGPEVDTDWGLEQLEMFSREVMPAFAEKGPA